ncbi:MAG: SsrA-binding protein [Gemmatimonadetes bacterium]|nr:SsrA-binding protein [Gemmatimonadota bacterium]
MSGRSFKLIARNRKARHDYEILETLEAGIALLGSEIKSLRAGKISLREGYVRVDANQAWLVGGHINLYEEASRFNHDPLRARKLLLHRREIEGLRAKIEEKGLTVVPLAVYIKGGWAKVEIGLARGKKHHDRRHEERRRQEERDAASEAARMRGRS